MIVYVDLFSGIGGFHKGILEAGIKIDKCYFSEIDKYATKAYEKQFPNSIRLGDVSKVDGTKFGKVNLLTFGFPCQDLSIAGHRKGLGGSRSGLFFEALRIIQECQPDTFIFENVEGLLTSNEGKDYEVVLRSIADLALYECEGQLVNTSWLLPQNRERIYFIGHLRGEGGQKVFPITESDCPSNGIQGQPITNSIKARYEAIGDGSYIIESELNAQDGRTKACCIRSQQGGGHTNKNYLMQLD